jgi:hypothetical protein
MNSVIGRTTVRNNAWVVRFFAFDDATDTCDKLVDEFYWRSSMSTLGSTGCEFARG